ncbi:hypothetical protein OnM2_008001 [Erysiphe neolycopersici]|uniref:Uncharacterized protein n=1 Tax=Erysiphe neolycopersici TaxID=212602 RepID=A0A420I6Z9_9PEZI|nr:hypothetical protein OnM2_008001 [Erysiphe neolycopersici]
MAARNISKFYDKLTSKTRIMKIFIQVEFGVTYSESDCQPEPSVECRFLKKFKAAASKLQNNEDDDSKSRELPTTFSTPWIRPLDLSGPFDKDQQEFWIMEALGYYNLTSAALQCQIPPSIDNNPHNSETNERDTFEKEGALIREKDLDLFHQATLTIGTFFYDSDSDIECEKPWKFPCLDGNYSSGNLNLPLYHGKTPKKAKRYGMYKNITSLW